MLGEGKGGERGNVFLGPQKLEAANYMHGDRGVSTCGVLSFSWFMVSLSSMDNSPISTKASSLKWLLFFVCGGAGGALCCPHLTLHPPKIFQPVPLWVATVLLGRRLLNTLRLRRATSNHNPESCTNDQSECSNNPMYWSSSYKDAAIDVK